MPVPQGDITTTEILTPEPEVIETSTTEEEADEAQAE
jgi:hypothetical protein